MHGCEWLPVHSDCEEGVAIIEHRLERGRGREAVVGLREDHVRSRLRPCPAEEFANGVAEPRRRPDEIPSHRVRDAGERRVLLFERKREELVHRERHLVLDHSVDPQGPGARIDRRRGEHGVDAVEVLLVGDEWFDPLDAEAGLGWDRPCPPRGAGEDEVRRGGTGLPRQGDKRLPCGDADRADHRRRAGEGEEAAAGGRPLP
ncbi:Uncharacterised protein [Mycobacteroides abscessus subsp. abscessus]|nr:Uncharacterised protein [Mycobacteroides abscessus subsp. abscessus]